jgi:hypothetical protein
VSAHKLGCGSIEGELGSCDVGCSPDYCENGELQAGLSELEVSVCGKLLDCSEGLPHTCPPPETYCFLNAVVYNVITGNPVADIDPRAPTLIDGCGTKVEDLIECQAECSVEDCENGVLKVDVSELVSIVCINTCPPLVVNKPECFAAGFCRANSLVFDSSGNSLVPVNEQGTTIIECPDDFSRHACSTLALTQG